MKEEFIRKSIETKKLQLTIYQEFIHFRVSIYIFVSSILLYFKNSDLCVLMLIISLISYLIRRHNLKLKNIKAEISSVIFSEIIENLVHDNHWEVEFKGKSILILRTQYSFSKSKYFFTNSIGERIYIFNQEKELLYLSTYILSEYDFIIPNGENARNEQIIKKAFY